MSSENPLGGPTITGPDGHVLHLPAPENPVAATYRKFVIDGGVLKTSTHFGTDAENKEICIHDVLRYFGKILYLARGVLGLTYFNVICGWSRRL